MAKIYYIINLDEQRFYVFDNYLEAKKKSQIFGMTTLKIGNTEHSVPKFDVESEKLKHYYGTVWVCYRFNTDTGACHYKLEGRWKDLKPYKEAGDTVKKFEMVPYNEYMEPAEVEEKTPEQRKRELEGLRAMLE